MSKNGRALGVAAILMVLTACGSARVTSSTTDPATPSASPSSVETPSTRPSASPSAEVGPLGYDPMTYKGFSQAHPARPADFKPIPRGATPAEIEKDFDNALNMIVASNDPSLWQKVRSLYVDLKPSSDGSSYAMDTYVTYVFTPGNGGAGNTNFGIGPSILVDALSANHAPRFVTGSDGTPIVFIPSSEKTLAWNDSDKAYVTTDTKPERVAVWAYKTQLPTPEGGTTSGWVQADPANYGLTP